MGRKIVKLPITNIHAGGPYTASIVVGSPGKALNVMLDTGSSAFALDRRRYSPANDRSAVPTRLLQGESFSTRKLSWFGPVVRTKIEIGGMLRRAKASVAVAELKPRTLFAAADGIVGLAYAIDDTASQMPGATWPPRYTQSATEKTRRVRLTPLFTQLVRDGIVANKFAFYTKRSQVSLATDEPEDDPDNKGLFILGGGERNKALYTGAFRTARVLHDRHYHTNLKWIRVGATRPIRVPPPARMTKLPSNSVVDSGTNTLIFEQWLYEAICDRFELVDRRLARDLRAGATASLPMARLDLRRWPTLTLALEGDRSDAVLRIKPQAYWQVHAPSRNRAILCLGGDNAGFGHTILGLPLLNGYFTLFDRSAGKGLGTVKFAAIR